jgi:hypothetical protein
LIECCPDETAVFISTPAQIEMIVAAALAPIQAELAERIDATREALLIEMAQDRKRLAVLEGAASNAPRHVSRGECLKALLAVNGGALLAADARKKLGICKPEFSKLLASMKDDVEVRPYATDRRKRVIRLK